MPRKRLALLNIKELLRLKYERNLSARQITQSLGISAGSVQKYISRARTLDLTWDILKDYSEQDIADLFYSDGVPKLNELHLPDWDKIAVEMKRKGVTLRLLWEEYRITNPNGLCYSHFCARFKIYKQTVDPRMLQVHRAGERLFVDYAGHTLPLTNPETGDIVQVQIFVATLGASSYTYAEATHTQSIPDWIRSHIRAFEFFGGVPELLVCDNLLSAVTTPCPYEPNIQRTYKDLAAHYHTAILPARVRKPRDKAKVEAGVQVVERHVLAPLRNRQFFTLKDMNKAIRDLLETLNNRKMQNHDHSRADLFELLDKPALQSLPENRYECAEWSYARVSVDYHITIDTRRYSVPYSLIHKQLDVRITSNVIEIFLGDRRVASHARIEKKYACSTQIEHMPAAHKSFVEWTPERLNDWLEQAGSSTRELGEAIIEQKAHILLGIKACRGLFHLGEKYGLERLEAACLKALVMKTVNFTSVKNILMTSVDTNSSKHPNLPRLPVKHTNLRGPGYFTDSEQVVSESSRDGSGGDTDATT